MLHLPRGRRVTSCIALLAPNDSMRFAYLCGQKQIIERLAKDNPSLTVELLTGELAKLDELALHDLGFDRSEMRSIAAEVTGEAEYTRMRERWTTFGLPM